MESSSQHVPKKELIEEIALLRTLNEQNAKNRQKLPEKSFNLIKENSIKGIKKLEKGGFNTLPIGIFQARVLALKGSGQAVTTERCKRGILVARSDGGIALFRKEININAILDPEERCYFKMHARALQKKAVKKKQITSRWLFDEHAAIFCAKNGDIRAFEGLKTFYLPEKDEFFSFFDLQAILD